MTKKNMSESALAAAGSAGSEPDSVDVRVQEDQIGDVEKRLLDTFGGPVGETAVRRSVSMAVEAVRFFGDDPGHRTGLIERIARNELELLQEGRNERAWT